MKQLLFALFSFFIITINILQASNDTCERFNCSDRNITKKFFEAQRITAKRHNFRQTKKFKNDVKAHINKLVSHCATQDVDTTEQTYNINQQSTKAILALLLLAKNLATSRLKV